MLKSKRSKRFTLLQELAALSAQEMAARSSVADVVATPLEGYFVDSLRYCSKLGDAQGGELGCAQYSRKP
eukprot:COSAG06_NODE_9091_length_1989_cov_1.165608_3_plen_70_part_00